MNDINADRVAEVKKREERAAFMRAFVLATLRSAFLAEDETITGAAIRARKAWDAIEAEAAK